MKENYEAVVVTQAKDHMARIKMVTGEVAKLWIYFEVEMTGFPDRLGMGSEREK